MSLERDTADLNSEFFLPEFTFANATFSPVGGTELELADSLIWLANRAIAIQLKERASGTDSTQDSEDRWFEKKVLKLATKQIRDTIKYLETNASINAINQRGQGVSLRGSELSQLVKLVVYSSAYPHNTKFYDSDIAGFIHVLSLEDYHGVVATLATLSEVFEYFNWREKLIIENSAAICLPEQSLLGHFLWGDADAPLELESMRYVYALQQKSEEWDVSGILHKFHSRAYDGQPNDNKYHRIIGEIAKLNRGGLRAFKERFMLSIEKAKKNEFTLPYRFAIPDSGSGFVFIPLEEQFRENRRVSLHNFTFAQKYVERLDRCVGIVFLADANGYFTIDWAYIEQPWVPDPEWDQKLAEAFPFRDAKPKRLDRYSFSPNSL